MKNSNTTKEYSDALYLRDTGKLQEKYSLPIATQIKLLYLIYCRKSSDEKSGKQILSNPAQIKELTNKARAENLNCINFLNPYKEERTAFKPGRPIFNEVLARIENGEANAILVWEISRLSRNPKDSGNLRWLMEEGKLKEVRTKDKIYGDADSLLMDIEFAMSNKESKQTSERTKRNLWYKVRTKKEWPGYAPMGFLNINENGLIAGKGFDKKKQEMIEKRAKKEKRALRRIEIDPIIGPLIKKLYDAFSTGLYSLEVMIQLTIKWGLLSHRSTPLSKSTIRRILSDPFYYGMFVFNGELCEGIHDAIVSKFLFDKVQEVLKARSKPITHRHNLLYSGLIKCGECGCAVCGDLKKGKYRLYRCTLKRRFRNCSQRHYISEEEIEKQLTKEIKKIAITDMVRNLLMLSIKGENNSEKRIHVTGLDHYQKVHYHCQERMSRLIDALTEGLIEKEEFLEKKQEILKQDVEAREYIKHHDDTLKAWHKYAENLIITANHAYKVFAEGGPEDKKALLKAVGTNFQLKNGLITFDLKPPFDYVVTLNKAKSSSPCYLLPN